MTTIYDALSALTTIAWAALALWCTPALWRVFRGHTRFYDPLRALVWLLVVNRFSFSTRRIIFGSRLDAMSSPELAWFLVTLAFSAACAVAIVIVVRGYERSR